MVSVLNQKNLKKASKISTGFLQTLSEYEAVLLVCTKTGL